MASILVNRASILASRSATMSACISSSFSNVTARISAFRSSSCSNVNSSLPGGAAACASSSGTRSLVSTLPCRRAESAGSSALVMLRALLRVRPGLVQSSEALPPEGAVYGLTPYIAQYCRQ